MGRSSKVKGNPVTLVGPELKQGDRAPEFKVLTNDLKDFSSDEFKGRLRLVASVPSLDTPVCDLEIKRFNEEAAKVSADIEIIFISCDLPFAQKRFCSAHGISQVKTFSDHRDVDFGKSYGVLIKELRLLSRAIFVIDKDDIIRYVEYVGELTSQPNYDKALEALGKVKV